MGEGPWRLARPHRRIDPALVEKAPGYSRKLWRKFAISLQHRVAGAVPREHFGHRFWQGRIAVPVFQLLLAKPFGFQPVIAVRQARIGGRHRADQRIDDLRLHPVRQVAALGHILETAPGVADVLVLGQRVGDQRKGAQIGLQGLGNGLRGIPAHGFAWVLHQVQHRLQRQFPGFDLEAQRRDGVVEQPVPGGAGGDGFFEEQLLQPVVELERLFLGNILQPRAVMRQRRGSDDLVQHAVVEPVEFKLEKQQVGRSRRDFFLGIAVKFGMRRIGGIAGIDQPGIGHDAPEQIVERLIALDGLRKGFCSMPACSDCGNPAAKIRREILAAARRLGQVIGIGL